MVFSLCFVPFGSWLEMDLNFSCITLLMSCETLGSPPPAPLLPPCWSVSRVDDLPGLQHAESLIPCTDETCLVTIRIKEHSETGEFVFFNLSHCAEL